MTLILITLILQKLAGDDESLNLGRAFVNPEGANVPVEPFDDRAAHEAGAAVNLERAVYDAPRRLGRVELGLARLARDALDARVLEVGRAVDQQARGVQLRHHVGQLLLNQLVLGQGAAELTPVLRVEDGLVERARRHAAGGSADARAEGVERAHRQTEAVALAPEHLFGRHAAVRELYLANRVRRDHLRARTHTEARDSRADDEGRKLRAPVLARARPRACPSARRPCRSRRAPRWR